MAPGLVGADIATTTPANFPARYGPLPVKIGCCILSTFAIVCQVLKLLAASEGERAMFLGCTARGRQGCHFYHMGEGPIVRQKFPIQKVIGRIIKNPHCFRRNGERPTRAGSPKRGIHWRGKDARRPPSEKLRVCVNAQENASCLLEPKGCRDAVWRRAFGDDAKSRVDAKRSKYCGVSRIPRGSVTRLTGAISTASPRDGGSDTSSEAGRNTCQLDPISERGLRKIRNLLRRPVLTVGGKGAHVRFVL